jgi:ubiquinone/menaquinone biosynthesis methyltransferase
MFDRIAPVYDAMNRVMTAGLDRRWRQITVRETVRAGDRVLDACCGTGDLAIAARREGAGDVVGLDFSQPMLDRAQRKDGAIEWIRGDMLALPFDDASFDAATVGFGVRKVRPRRSAARQGAAGRRRLHVPAGERAQVSGSAGALGAARAVRLLARPVQDVRRRYRRAARGGR